ncbi:MAG: c-type cytochrome, partial [Sulfurimicrobium sp.]|nr:c-type cytochrome [Sulfurimicrobium sp.]
MKILMSFLPRSNTKPEIPHRAAGQFFAVFFVLVLGFSSLDANAFDAERARDLMGVCATCHGDFGQGGARGEYPRIAGQSEKYLASQLESF